MSDSVGSRPGAARPAGLTSATALIIGTIIGVGVFNLPTSLATFGPISLMSMALTTIGALALALLFAALSRLGCTNAWSYWITAWPATPPSTCSA